MGEPRVIVYTAIYGDHIDLAEIPKEKGVDYVCFTDDEKLRSFSWDVRVARGKFQHPRLSAKYFRMFPHHLFPGHDRSLWIDGSIHVKSPTFVEEALSSLSPHVTLFRHPHRQTIHDEALFSETMKKYEGEPMRAQIAHYKGEGFLDDQGLYATGILLRRNTEKMRTLNEQWMLENVRWSYQDQLSFPYLLWKLDISPGTFPLSLYQNRWFSIGWEKKKEDAVSRFSPATAPIPAAPPPPDLAPLSPWQKYLPMLPDLGSIQDYEELKRGISLTGNTVAVLAVDLPKISWLSRRYVLVLHTNDHWQTVLNFVTEHPEWKSRARLTKDEGITLLERHV